MSGSINERQSRRQVTVRGMVGSLNYHLPYVKTEWPAKMLWRVVLPDGNSGPLGKPVLEEIADMILPRNPACLQSASTAQCTDPPGLKIALVRRHDASLSASLITVLPKNFGIKVHRSMCNLLYRKAL